MKELERKNRKELNDIVTKLNLESLFEEVVKRIKKSYPQINVKADYEILSEFFSTYDVLLKLQTEDIDKLIKSCEQGKNNYYLKKTFIDFKFYSEKRDKNSLFISVIENTILQSCA